MRSMRRKLAAFVLSLALMLTLAGREGSAVLDGVYFSAVNEQLLELSADTMPFYSRGVLYISNRFFEGTDLDVRYVKNSSMGLAVLYTTKTDLRFDLVNRTVYDKVGTYYEGRAIEKNGYVFFPLEFVCKFFGLRWSLNETETAPLLRVRSDSSILSDRSFIDAASGQMADRYAVYEKNVQNSRPPTPELPPIHAAEGQKVYLILSSASPEATREAIGILGESRATFLLTRDQMEDGDFLRMLTGMGHGVALRIQGETAEEVERDIREGREMLWQSTRSLMQLVWYEGSADVSSVFEKLGCVALRAEIDRREKPIRSQSRVVSLLTAIGRYREDLPVYLGSDAECAEGLAALVGGLTDAQYRLCAWRLNA